MNTKILPWLLPLLLFLFVASAAFAKDRQFQSSHVIVASPKVVEIQTPYRGSVLFVPHDGKPHAGIILLHGSEGGALPFYRLEAQAMAMHGYAVLAFCWYNCGQSPISSPYLPLENINLNTTLEAMSWLKSSQYVEGRKIALYGFSRGAEQTLILGWQTALTGENMPDALAVHAPSDVVAGGVNLNVMDQRCWVCRTFDLSCFNNSKDSANWNLNEVRWNPACGEMPKDPEQFPMAAWTLNGKPLATGSRIEIEKFPRPIFISHGTRDELWESARTERLQTTLEKAGRHPEVHIFANEKHNFSLPAENKRRAMVLHYFKKVLN